MSAARLCFAFGSNLCAGELARCLAERGLDASHVRAAGPALLPDHALAFGRFSHGGQAGVLDVRPMRGSVVEGALLEATPEGWAALDGKEGVDSGAYVRRLAEVVRPDGTVIPATVHVAAEPRRGAPFCAPDASYLRRVEDGLVAWRHDPAPLHRAAEGGSGASFVDAVFVYGTLLVGESNAHVLHGEPVRRIVPAQVKGALHETGERYPVMVLDDASTVEGELVELDDVERRLAALDVLEEFDGYARPECPRPGRLYHRTIVPVTCADGTRRAWTYVAGETIALGARIGGGRWRGHRLAARPAPR